MKIHGMTHEERAAWIRRIFILLLSMGIVAGVWFYQKDDPAPPPRTEVAAGYELEIIHYHQPGNPESEQIADSLDKVGSKYHQQVFVTRVDVTANPAAAKARGVARAPQVCMMAGDQEAFAFQGLWPYFQIERKVEEILRGLKRVGKDWRPEVKGMLPAGKAAAPPPENPARL